MKFNTQAFDAKEKKKRMEDIPIQNPQLKKFFEPETEEETDDSPCFFKIQQLTGLEVAMVNQEISNSKNLDNVLDGLFGSVTKEKMSAIKDIIGIANPAKIKGEPDVLPDEYVRRMYMILYGLIDPVFEDVMAVRRFADHFPTEFYHISSKIISITGMGAEVGE